MRLKLNKIVEEENHPKTHKNPLKTDKARGIRNIVAHGIPVPKRRTTQDDKSKQSGESDRPLRSESSSSQGHDHPSEIPSATSTTVTATNKSFSRKSSREQNRGLSSTSPSKKEQDHSTVGHKSGESSADLGAGSSHHGAKAKLSNLSRNFFSKDKDKDKEKEKEKEKERVKVKDHEKERDKEKDKDKDRSKNRIWDKKGNKHKEKGPKTVQLASKVLHGKEKQTLRLCGYPFPFHVLQEGLGPDPLVLCFGLRIGL